MAAALKQATTGRGQAAGHARARARGRPRRRLHDRLPLQPPAARQRRLGRADRAAQPFHVLPYAYAVKPGDDAWLAAVDEFVARIKRDGRLQAAAQAPRADRHRAAATLTLRAGVIPTEPHDAPARRPRCGQPRWCRGRARSSALLVAAVVSWLGWSEYQRERGDAPLAQRAAGPRARGPRHPHRRDHGRHAGLAVRTAGDAGPGADRRGRAAAATRHWSACPSCAAWRWSTRQGRCSPARRRATSAG